MLSDKREEDGFTLIELLVVVAIIGIISTFAVASFVNQRQASQDSRTTDTLTAVHKTADTYILNSDPETLDLAVLATAGIEGITAGTVVGIQGTENGYCATAYHPDGTYTETEPLLYDSIKGDFIYDEGDFVPGGACQPTQMGNPIEPAFIVEEGQLERLTPADAPLPSVCHSVEPYTYSYDLEAIDTSGERHDLEARIALSDDCREITYEVRIVDADETATYSIPLSFSNLTEGGSFSPEGNPVYPVVIEGTETVEGSIPTNWKPSSTWQGINLNDAWEYSDGDVFWRPAQAPVTS